MTVGPKTPLPPAKTQRLHDLRAVHSNFKSVLGLLKSGYRFDDADAPAALAQLDQAVNSLLREIQVLESEWRP